MSQYSVIVKSSNNSTLENVIFESKEQAIIAFESYRNRINYDFQCVALLNIDSRNILWLLWIEEGVVYAEVKDGSIVKLRDGYYEPGEEKYLYVASNINENTGRCLITCINGGNAIPAAENVDIKMIEVVSNSK